MKWTTADKRRRWFGLFYVISAAGMFIWGQTWLEPHLRGLVFVFYWLACFGLTMLAILTALLDIWVIRLRQQSQESEAAKRALHAQPPPKPTREAPTPKDSTPSSD